MLAKDWSLPPGACAVMQCRMHRCLARWLLEQNHNLFMFNVSLLATKRCIALHI